MVKSTTALLLLLCCAAEVAAQPRSDGSPAPLHVTDVLLKQPVGREALLRFHAGKTQVRPYASKALEALAIGDTTSFEVRDLAAEDSLPAPQFLTLTFTKKDETAGFILWVEEAELSNEHVRDQDVAELRQALADATPPGSLDPARGILANNEILFGQPPLSGKVNVLLTDVRDGRGPGQGFVAGFVDPLDLTAMGNGLRMLYLDTQPGLYTDAGTYRGTQGAQKTAAHEYQHLIHLNYDGSERTFVNEGLSEYAEVANGYTARSIGYLSSRARRNVPLYRWSTGLDGDIHDDYQRAGLFTNYLADRIGPVAAGSVTRQSAQGDAGYQAALDALAEPLPFAEILLDFHTTNLLNRDVDGTGRFAYTTPQRSGLTAQPLLVADGRLETETSTRADTVRAGAALYLSWIHVTDFEFVLDAAPSDPTLQEALRSRTALRALLESGDGTVEVRDLDLGASAGPFQGYWERVTLVVAHLSPEDSGDGGTPLSSSARWSGGGGFIAETLQYDDGQTDGFIQVGGAELTTRFEHPAPEDGMLAKVWLPLYFYNQFGGSTAPPEAPRDFTLVVRAATSEGLPGPVLFSFTREDPRPYTQIADRTLEFLELDLSPYVDTLGALPQHFFLGYKDAGSDDNGIILAPSYYAPENVSFAGGDGSWRPLWEIELANGDTLTQSVVPIRAEFLIPHDVPSVPPPPDEEPPPPAGALALRPNYPNPFRGQTMISYHLPAASEVQLAVYDVLGRRVAVLVEGPQQAGPHTVSLDAANWPSGSYFYTLRTDRQYLTRRMVLIR